MSNVKMNEKDFREKWQGNLGNVSIDELPNLLRDMLEDANDYGTICLALGFGATATAWAMNKEPNGGITGFQSGFVMWEFIRQWNYNRNRCGMKIIDYDKLLYPQYNDYFDKVIPENIWKSVQEEARNLLETHKDLNPDVLVHWQSIVDGVVPFCYRVDEEV